MSFILSHTGIFIVEALLKYEEKSSASRVALIKISFSSGLRARRSLRTTSRKSAQKKIAIALS